MVKAKGGSGGKKTIISQNKGELRDAGKQMRGGHTADARRMADASIAKRQGVRRGGGGRGR